MSKIRSVSALEKKFSKLLSAAAYPMGYRYRLNYKGVPGKPDIAFVSRKIAVFVDGDFWHGYQFHKKRHKLPSAFWVEKIQNNMRRDRRNRRALRAMGWSYVRLWEHEIMKKPDACVAKVLRALLDSERAILDP